MTKHSLSNLENQEINAKIGESIYSFRLYPIKGLMYYDLAKDGEDVVCGLRVIPWTWLIPFQGEANIGNLRFESFQDDRNSYPWYEDFDEKFWIVEYSAEEYSEVKG